VSPHSLDPEKAARQLANLRNAPPAPRGNTRTLRHGGRATAATLPVSEVVLEIRNALADAAPVRDQAGELPAADEATVELAARALCRVRRVEAWCDLHGFLDEKTGDVKPAVNYLEKATRTADQLLASLGMNPRARTRLGLDLARTTDLATAMSEPDDDRRRELLAEAGVEAEAE
jgi:Phage terminase, small subunit